MPDYELELDDGGCLQYEADSKKIRYIDQWGNTEDIRSPGDEKYSDWLEAITQAIQNAR